MPRTTITWSASSSGSTNSAEMTQLLQAIPAHVFHFSNEDDLQQGLAQLLTQLGMKFQREFRLSPHHRIDFYLPDPKLGIEVKVEGSPASVTRQVHQYTGYEQIAELLLVTSRIKLGRLPQTMRGKPVGVVSVGGNWM